jgi:hypothetical protein
MTIQQRRDDYPNPWRIQVRGHPARRESNSWREAIRNAVKGTYPQAPFSSPPSGTKFTVEVIFRMTPEDLARPAFDLDNFAKPVLDTLFTSQNVSPSVTGLLLPVNDTWVFRLVLEKIRVETLEDQGADITVTSHPPGAPDLSAASASPSVESRSTA